MQKREVPFIFFTKQMFEKVFLCLKVITHSEFKDYLSIKSLYSNVFAVKSCASLLHKWKIKFYFETYIPILCVSVCRSDDALLAVNSKQSDPHTFRLEQIKKDKNVNN